jgi:hypothetical protein|tara:strand:+ start:2084 stop:2236 length:153 start_codon:yes stop_codon:yes gene_type:complete
MSDNNCFCCGASMSRFETEKYVYHYCFVCNDNIENNDKIIENFAAEYESD